MGRSGGTLGTGLRYFLTVLLGMSLSMVLAYGTVRYLTRGTTFVMDLSPQERDRAWALRAAANALARSCNEFQEAMPVGAATPAAGTQRWLQESWLAALDEASASLEVEGLMTLPEAVALRGAMDRTRTLARHPDDAALRKAVLGEVARALEGVNALLNTPRLRGSVALPPVGLQ